MNFVTFGGSHERALHAAIDEAPTLEDRCNTVAGLVWAVTLVNIRHPAVLANLLRLSRAIRMPAAVTNGVVSVLMVWKDMVPETGEVLRPYFRSTPPTPPYSGFWNDIVAVPAAHAFAETRPAIASLFQYRETKLAEAQVDPA